MIRTPSDDPEQPGAKCNSLDGILPPRPPVTRTSMDIAKEQFEQAASTGGLAYTITYSDTNLARYRETYLIQYTLEIIRKTKGYKLCSMIPEYSKTGRIHMHGVIKMGTMANHSTLQRKLRREFGMIKVKPIDNTVKWRDYCFKDKQSNSLKDCIMDLIINKTNDNIYV